MLIVLAGAAVGLYLLDQYKNWPWWVGAAIFVGLLGLILAGLFLKKWFFRRREKKFVQRIVEQDESVMAKKPVGERRTLLDLESRWRTAVELLKQSHLRDRGHPLYVLPWYLLLGAPGSGKSTALSGARLSAPLTEVSGAAGEGPTGSCNWWFFENSVIMDTAGRYTVPEDPELDKEEWQKFLSLLIKNRRSEPLDGLVATVSADQLINAGDDALSEEARNLRRRVDELMRVQGARLPVYILVTKLDQVMGLTDFVSHLPEKARGQALGLSNDDVNLDPEVFVARTVSAVTEAFKDLRLKLMAENGNAASGLMLLPSEFETLRPGLARFVRTVFEENLYQETPILRGIYLSSGRQSGEARSKIIEQTESFKDRVQVLKDTEYGIFLRDFFSRILPEGRGLRTPLKEFITWKTLTKSLALTATAAIILSICGLLTLSYTKNTATMNAFYQDFPAPPKLTENMAKDLMLMTDFRNQISELDGLNQNWWMPRLGLDQSLAMERDLKALYCHIFRTKLLKSLDTELAKQAAAVNFRTSGKTIGFLVSHMATRINLLNARLQGQSDRKIEALPPASYLALRLLDENLLEEIAQDFSPIYLSYLEWSEEDWFLRRELDGLQIRLAHVTDAGGENLHWLVEWANDQPGLQPITQETFWGDGNLDEADRIEVSGAYTLDGRAQIEEFLKMYAMALGRPDVLNARLGSFNGWYWRQYVGAWTNFGLRFDQGFIRLGDDDERKSLAEIMADPQNPYFLLMEKMAEELTPITKQPDPPPWIVAVIRFEQVKQEAAADAAKQKATGLAKVVEEGQTAARRADVFQEDRSLKTPGTGRQGLGTARGL